MARVSPSREIVAQDAVAQGDGVVTAATTDGVTAEIVATSAECGSDGVITGVTAIEDVALECNDSGCRPRYRPGSHRGAGDR